MIKSVQTEDRIEEVLKDQIKVYEKALTFCNHANLKDILKDSLLDIQNQLINLRDSKDGRQIIDYR